MEPAAVRAGRPHCGFPHRRLVLFRRRRLVMFHRLVARRLRRLECRLRLVVRRPLLGFPRVTLRVECSLVRRLMRDFLNSSGS